MNENIFTLVNEKGEIPSKFNIQLKALPTEGNIAWEYNPFRNYRLDEDLYEYDGYYYNLYQLDKKYHIQLNCPIEAITDSKNEIPNYDDPNISYIIGGKKGDYSEIIEKAFRPGYNYSRKRLIQAIAEFNLKTPITWINVPKDKTDPVLRQEGELVDFITNELEFSLNHPVDMIPQNSYDDSVNLIMNDGFSYPKLINSRFSPRGRNTYEICDRKGNADTNIYDRGEQFKTDTSLYKTINTFPKLKLVKITNGGSMKVGNYFFYFRLADADGNETDFFEESGLVSIFKGGSTYASTSTGERNENSFKQVIFQLSNLDTSYSYVNVYYSRASSEADFNKAVMVAKIDQKYLINSTGISNITITGFEPTVQLTEQDLNLTYSLVDCAETSATCQNRLFLANIQKPFIDYELLEQLSLRFLPRAVSEDYDVNITNRYTIQSGKKGYIDPMYIYSKTGYWNKELYRLGIVYIMKNGELSPVFNIRGAYNLGEQFTINGKNDIFETTCTNIPLYAKGAKKTKDNIKKIEYDEETYKLLLNDAEQSPNVMYENVRGVVRMNRNDDTKKVHYFAIDTDIDTIEELKKHVKGFFFVRQHRIPTILAQAITIGIDKHGRVPTLPIDGEDKFLTQMQDQLTNKTHVRSEDLNGLNYISEGFMTRYKFDFKKKHSSIWKQIGMITAAVLAIAAIAVASVFTFGAAGIVAGVTVPVLFGSLTAAGTLTAIIAGGVVAATVVTAVVVGGIQEAVYASNRTSAKKRYNGWETEVPEGYEIKEEKESRILDNDFRKRLIVKDKDANEVAALLCPEFDVKQAYYNSIFCGNECYLESAISQGIEINRMFPKPADGNPYSYRAFTMDNRHLYIKSYSDNTAIKQSKSRIVALTDNQKTVAIDDIIFRGRAGEAEEAWKVTPVSNHHLKDRSNEYNVVNMDNRTINSDYVRGIYGPYLAMEPTTVFTPAETVNIYVPGYDPANYESYVMIRAQDYSPYKAISERIDIQDLTEYDLDRTVLMNDSSNNGKYTFSIFRGDCYICKYTHRFNRNFCDPSAPYNDEIVDPECWRNGFDLQDTTKYQDINTGDVNAIQLGMWVTFDVRSTVNLNVLTLDNSHVDEKAMTGHARGHFPQLPMSTEGSYKMAESAVYNAGMEVSLSERYNFIEPDVPYIKQWYGTRIMYSDVQITDAFKNGYRQFWSTNYRDYPVDYGSITKILNWKGSLCCVFEHAVAIIPVNERTVAGQGIGGYAYINTENVLPANPNIISDKFGSQWKDSIIATPKAIYGVDTVGKKIWRTDGNSFELISDFVIQDFLNKHISLSERELEPIIGIRNVKTHYNEYKHDIMFTFYDNLYDFEEESWNLCYNELLGKWITFYSWIPSFSENIYNQYFSFDRDTSKAIAKLGMTNDKSQFANGITLTNNLLSDNIELTSFTDKDGNTQEGYLVGTLDLRNRHLPSGDGVTNTVEYELVRDVWKNYEQFVISNDGNLYYLQNPNTLRTEIYQRKYYHECPNGVEYVILDDPLNPDATTWALEDKNLRVYGVHKEVEGIGPSQIITKLENNKTYMLVYQNLIYLNKPTSIYKDDTGKRINIKNVSSEQDIIKFLNIRAKVNVTVEDRNKTLAEAYVSGFNNLVSMDAGYYQSTIAITHKHNIELLTTDFWKHGQAGIIDIQDTIRPTYWYGKQHPFEFEFVVRNNPQLHKIFDNLEIISNKAAPESFHYEIVGECYDFAKDKKNMYIRQEATKELYQYNGSNITYDHNYKKLQETPKDTIGNLYEKSTIMPLYYVRQDKVDEIKDSYHSYNEVLNSYKKNNGTKNFDALAGGEIVYYDKLNEYRIWNHTKAVDVRTTAENDWTRGNMYYKEDKWDIQINPINYVQMNESIASWETSKGQKVPINFNLFNPPADLEINQDGSITKPEGWVRKVNNEWSTEDNFQEAKIKDKVIKIRIRYSGEDLAVILAINTLYSISFA